MGTKFTYALVLTVSGAVFSLLMFFLGFQTEKIATGQYLNWLMFPLSFVVLWLGIKAVREERPHQAISYGAAVGAGTVISLMSSAMSAVYTFVHMKFINTSGADYQLALMREKWAAANIPDAQIEKMEAMTRSFMTPGFASIMALIMGVVFGLILSLIIAAFLKRAAPEGAEPPL